MKKIFITVAILISTFLFGSAQQLPNKNIVVVENFTNTGCGPCAKFSPVLDKVVNDRLGDVICIKCHGSYPDHKDPFYLEEKSNLDERMKFYDITAFPTLLVNGIERDYTLSPTLLNSMLDAAREIDMKYNITISSKVTNHKLVVEGNIVSLEDVADASNLRLFVVAIEEYYKSPTAFSNGETEMEFVAKRFMPDGRGMIIGQSMDKNKAYGFNFSCDLNSFRDERELGIVAYVQDISTKQIVASAYIPKAAKADDYANLISITDTPDFICTPDFYGKAMFRNDGKKTLTSAKINVEVNGVPHSYNWSGNLARLGRTSFQFEDITDFVLSTDGVKNTAKVWLTDINATSNESNAIVVNFSNSIQAEHGIRMRIYTDKKPEETTWKVFDSAGEVVQAGGPYTEARHKYTETFRLKVDDCYTLAIYDSGGDGISSTAYGNGYYQIYQVEKSGGGEETTKLLTQGTFTNAECAIAFNLKKADPNLSINDVKLINKAHSTITIFDESGKMLLNTTVEKLTPADMSSVGKGVRIVKINEGKRTYVRKYIINR